MPRRNPKPLEPPRGVSLPEKVTALLNSLEKGSKVAIVTLLGSLCPITVGHVQVFVEARRMLQDHCLVLGFISLNPDQYVDRKFERAGQGQSPLDYNQRLELVQLVIADMDWISTEAFEGSTVETLKHKWPKLKFNSYSMNGADDVLKRSKWKWTASNDRYITMGRPGVTEKLLEKLAEEQVNSAHFLMGPELSNVSSTQAREALERGDHEALDEILDPRVKQWCLQHGPWGRQGQEKGT